MIIDLLKPLLKMGLKMKWHLNIMQLKLKKLLFKFGIVGHLLDMILKKIGGIDQDLDLNKLLSMNMNIII